MVAEVLFLLYKPLTVGLLRGVDVAQRSLNGRAYGCMRCFRQAIRMSHKQALKTRRAIRQPLRLSPRPLRKSRVVGSCAPNTSSNGVRVSGATLPSGAVLTMTHRFDNLLSSKTGPSGTQALLWDGQNVATASGPAYTAASPGGSAVFLGTDLGTKGNWIGVYGSESGALCNDK